MTEAIKREDWFLPPEGILDGTPFEIAQGFIARERADQAYFAEHPLSSDPAHIKRIAEARPEAEALLDEYEQRLAQGDEELAEILTIRVEREVEDLNRGLRSTVTGQGHLLAERNKYIGRVWGVVVEDIPTK